MTSDLFSAAAAERLKSQAPLAARLRPRALDEVVGQRHLVAKNSPLRSLIEGYRLSSVIFWGPPGTGKTTLAEVVALTTNRHFERLSAVSTGVKDVSEVIERASDDLVSLVGGRSYSSMRFIGFRHLSKTHFCRRLNLGLLH